MSCGFFNGTSFNLRDSGRYSDHNSRTHPFSIVHFRDEMPKHRLGHFKVGNNAIFERSDCHNIARCPPEHLTKTAALEFAKQGVRVNSVSPGPIQTEMFDRTFGEGETDVKKTIATQNPVGRIGTPEEIASAVLWLSSPGAAFTTGQDIIVDGGYTAQ